MEFATSLIRELYKNNISWRQKVKDKGKIHSPEKLPPSMKRNKQKLLFSGRGDLLMLRMTKMAGS